MELMIRRMRRRCRALQGQEGMGHEVGDAVGSSVSCSRHKGGTNHEANGENISTIADNTGRCGRQGGGRQRAGWSSLA